MDIIFSDHASHAFMTWKGILGPLNEACTSDSSLSSPSFMLVNGSSYSQTLVHLTRLSVDNSVFCLRMSCSLLGLSYIIKLNFSYISAFTHYICYVIAQLCFG